MRSMLLRQISPQRILAPLRAESPSSPSRRLPPATVPLAQRAPSPPTSPSLQSLQAFPPEAPFAVRPDMTLGRMGSGILIAEGAAEPPAPPGPRPVTPDGAKAGAKTAQHNDAFAQLSHGALALQRVRKSGGSIVVPSILPETGFMPRLEPRRNAE